MSDFSTVYLGLGSNLGDRAGNLAAAARLLTAASGIDLTSVSPIYETSPVDASGSFFLNAAASARTILLPKQLLAVLKAIEKELGRPSSGARGAARIIDLDILAYENVVMETDELILPHPRIRERLFVLYPLADLAPDLIISPGDPTASELLRAARSSTGNQEAIRLGSFWKITGFRVS